MQEREGVIKFDLRFLPAPPLPFSKLRELNAWRAILNRLDLIGQTADRYDGLGFGNLSQRLSPSQHFAGSPAPLHGRGTCLPSPFVITGTQTGHLRDLDQHHYAIVTAADVQANHIAAHGPIAPSSESLTHAMLYCVDEAVQFIFHVHSPQIWRNAARLGMPVTDPGVAYGTPAMAEEVLRLSTHTAAWRQGIFAMGGHEDGIIAFGKTAEETGIILLRNLAQAMVLASA